jgi:molybdate transport system ATP-binding protein
MLGSSHKRLRIDVRKRLGAFDFAADLDLPLQGLTALFGASGAGKSTLVNLVAGLQRPDQGHIAVGSTVFFDSAAGMDVPVERRALGVVFQDARLFPHMTVEDNLRFGLKRAGARANGSDRLRCRSSCSGSTRLAVTLTLSGGEGSALHSACLLACPHLPLDEPLASRRPRKRSTCRAAAWETGIDPVSAMRWTVLRLATSPGDRVRQGCRRGDVGDVLRLPAAQASLGEADVGTLIFGRVRSHDDAYQLTTIDCAGFDLKVPRVDLRVGSALRARIPARDVALSLARPSDVSISNRIEGGVESIVPLAGPHVQVHVQVGDQATITARITRESADRLALVPGLRVWCLIKTVALDAGTLSLAHGAP